ncbi:uncharacterized protein N7482_002231 [Penicillium canariense]|uniref:Uncharacterized protein n=1 Tax=Penicillium canariense TaxID=189055 RepID=A0A9W9IHF4_9EURO|nr:uncharacterized protein N7482_002231 [Penicillium canariense]KAJ5176354.1 hypothetical protein N7482_002231 [Penicillium canariense]
MQYAREDSGNWKLSGDVDDGGEASWQGVGANSTYSFTGGLPVIGPLQQIGAISSLGIIRQGSGYLARAPSPRAHELTSSPADEEPLKHINGTGQSGWAPPDNKCAFMNLVLLA